MTPEAEAYFAGALDRPLAPDEPVAQDWTAFGTERDAVLAAALAWLRRSEASP